MRANRKASGRSGWKMGDGTNGKRRGHQLLAETCWMTCSRAHPPSFLYSIMALTHTHHILRSYAALIHHSFYPYRFRYPLRILNPLISYCCSWFMDHALGLDIWQRTRFQTYQSMWERFRLDLITQVYTVLLWSTWGTFPK